MPTKNQTEYTSFAALDIRVGVILSVEDAVTKKPTYRLTIDFGADVGVKRSCGAYRCYPKEFLVGRQVVAVVNFAPKKMGPEVSEVLVLGVTDLNGKTVFLTPEQTVELGVEVF